MFPILVIMVPGVYSLPPEPQSTTAPKSWPLQMMNCATVKLEVGQIDQSVRCPPVMSRSP